MIDFSANMKKNEFGISLEEMDEFAEFMKEGAEMAKSMIHSITDVAQKTVKSLGAGALPVFSISLDSFFEAYDTVMSPEELDTVTLEFNGSDESADYVIYARAFFEEKETFTVSVCLIKHTEEGELNFVPATGKWEKIAPAEEDDELVLLAEEYLGDFLDEKEKEMLLGANVKLKELREHPMVKHLVCYDNMDRWYEQEEIGGCGVEDICPVLVPEDPHGAGFYVIADGKTGEYCLVTEVLRGDLVDIFVQAYGMMAEEKVDAIREGTFCAFRTSSADEMAQVLVRLLDHYMGCRDYTVYPLSGNEYVLMTCNDRNRVAFCVSKAEEGLSPAGSGNMKILLGLLAKTEAPEKD